MYTITVEDIAKLVGGTFSGDGGLEIKKVSPIEDAQSGDLTFISGEKYAPMALTTKAAAIMIPAGFNVPSEVSDKKAIIFADNPYYGFAQVLNFLHPLERHVEEVSDKASVSEKAAIGKGVFVGPCVVIEDGAIIGDNVHLTAGVFVGKDVSIGENTFVYANVTIREGCKIGSNVILQPNCVIGSDGFGFAKKDPKGSYLKIPQVGIVVIEDNVEIGAGVCIDRAALGVTRIGRGTKLDNLVHISHNMEIGEDCAIAAQAGFAGSVKIGDRFTSAGQVAISGHLEVCDDVTLGGKAGVTKNITKSGVYTGYPHTEHKNWLKQQILISKLPEMSSKIKELEKELKELKNKK